MSKYRVEKCRSCGAEIIWIETDAGSHIPVNKTRAHGYIINAVPPGPEHLFLGTCLDNVRDAIRKGRNVVIGGERHGMSKINVECVREIRHRYIPRDPVNGAAALGREFGLHRAQVARIVAGENWGEAPKPKPGNFWTERVLAAATKLPPGFHRSDVCRLLGRPDLDRTDGVIAGTLGKLQRTGRLKKVRAGRGPRAVVLFALPEADAAVAALGENGG